MIRAAGMSVHSSVPSTDMAAQCSTAWTLWPAGLYAYAYTQRALRECSGHTHFRTWRVAKMEVTPSHRDLAMSSRKGTADSAPTTSSKKRKVTVTTFNKWKTQFERDHSTPSWLRCDGC